MNIIDTQEVKRRLDEGPVALFDVRGDVLYEQGHIPGSKTAPMGSLVFRVAGTMKPDSFVAVYSAGNGCTMAREAAERLEGLGLRNVHCYEEGIAGWVSAGHPLVESPFAKVQARGPVVECRPIVVDTKNAYGGAFAHTSDAVESAGG